MKKRAASRLDIFSQVQNPQKYSQAFKGLPDLRNLDCAKYTIKRLDKLYRQYKKNKDKNGLLHCKLIAEIALSRTIRRGRIRQQNLFAEWLKKIK
jgi:hypothetical protein